MATHIEAYTAIKNNDNIELKNILNDENFEINKIFTIISDDISYKTYLLYEALIYCDKSVIELLLVKGADPDIKVNNNTLSCLTISTMHNNIDIIQLLLDYDANINVTSYLGTSLNISVMYNSYDKFKLLLDNNADINKSIPIITAAIYGNIIYVKELVELGCIIDKQNNEGKNALYYAVMYVNYDIVKYLLYNGSNPLIKDNNGNDSLKIAKKILKLLLENNINYDFNEKYNFNEDSNIYNSIIDKNNITT